MGVATAGDDTCAMCYFYMQDPTDHRFGACAFKNGHVSGTGFGYHRYYCMVYGRDKASSCEYYAADKDAADEVVQTWQL